MNILEDAEFAEFHDVLHGKLKALNRTEKYVENKKARVITIKMEETLWKNSSLGDHNPQALLNTLVYLIRLNVALRSGEEYRWLHHKPSQINVINPEGEAPYIAYIEDISKTTRVG